MPKERHDAQSKIEAFDTSMRLIFCAQCTFNDIHRFNIAARLKDLSIVWNIKRPLTLAFECIHGASIEPTVLEWFTFQRYVWFNEKSFRNQLLSKTNLAFETEFYSKMKIIFLFIVFFNADHLILLQIQIDKVEFVLFVAFF